MSFHSAYFQGYARMAACTLPVATADPMANAVGVAAQARACHDESVAVAIFPELCLSGYAIDDLFLQETLLNAVETALGSLLELTKDLMTMVVVGAPLVHGNRVLNTAVVCHRGRILGIAPKSHLPTYREFYEARHFGSGADLAGSVFRFRDPDLAAANGEIPLGPDLIFAATDLRDLRLHVEVCEDMWVPVPPSSRAALAGATVLANLSGSPITIGRAEDRRVLVRSASARCLAAYLYAAAGQGESTTDLSWDGQTMIYECGDLLGESERFPDGARRTIVDVDLRRLAQERLRQGTFDDNRRSVADGIGTHRTIAFTLQPPTDDIGLRRKVDRFPFVPDDPERLARDCYEAFNIQVSGLERRLDAIGGPKVIIGVSGGLDSTHALLVAARTMDRAGRPRSDIEAFTLPGFATSDETKGYATRLATALGVSFSEIDIRPAARLMLRDLGHPYAEGEADYDITFENVQAGLRTDYLFRLANYRRGIVLGTGDLSELALGWCTYGVGDQMSHYNVNAGVPKTLIQHLIRWVMTTDVFGAETNDVLDEILDHEITPELIPADGKRPQSTQEVVGPYELQDFTLFHTLRRGSTPSRIAFLAYHAWSDANRGEWPPNLAVEDRHEYDLAAIRRWLVVFVSRFFSSQFKRSALPNGPKVSAGGTLSPRGDWRMPSDATASAWLAEIEAVIPTGEEAGPST